MTTSGKWTFFGPQTVKAPARRIAVASNHNILAHTDKSEAKGLATSAASAWPMVTASANPLDH